MLSAPAHIPAIRVSSFGPGFTAPDATFVVVIETFSASRSGRRVCSAKAMTGTSPAHETRLSSSNMAEPSMNLWDTFTGSAFRELVDLLCENSNLPSSGGTFFSSTRCCAADPSVESGLAGSPAFDGQAVRRVYGANR